MAAVAHKQGALWGQILLLADGLPEDVSVDTLISAGAVGDLLGYFPDETGALIDHEINARVPGIRLDDLNDLPNVILAAGGLNKAAIISAILRRGCIDHLVTDEHLARVLIDGAP